MDRLDSILQDMRANATKPAAAAPTRRAHTVTAPLASRRVRYLLIAAVLLLCIVALAAWSGSKTEPTPIAPSPHVTRAATPSPTASETVDGTRPPAPLQWQPVVERLDAQRWRAFRSANKSELLQVNEPGSAAMRIDTDLVQRLRALKAHVATSPVHVIAVTEQFVTMGDQRPRAMLTVIDRMDAYDIVDQRGTLLRRVPARGPVTWNVELVNGKVDGWVYRSVVRAVTP